MSTELRQLDKLTPSDEALLDALWRLMNRAGAVRGEPFRTTRAAMIVESNLKPITLDCSLYRTTRDGWITRDGRPGKGTWITFVPLNDSATTEFYRYLKTKQDQDGAA